MSRPPQYDSEMTQMTHVTLAATLNFQGTRRPRRRSKLPETRVIPCSPPGSPLRQPGAPIKNRRALPALEAVRRRNTHE